MFVIGKSETPRIYYLIVDDEGGVETSKDYLNAHPTWYEYIGYSIVNGDHYYSYRHIT